MQLSCITSLLLLSGRLRRATGVKHIALEMPRYSSWCLEMARRNLTSPMRCSEEAALTLDITDALHALKMTTRYSSLAYGSGDGADRLPMHNLLKHTSMARAKGSLLGYTRLHRSTFNMRAVYAHPRR